MGCGSKEVAASGTEVVKAQLESFSVVVQKLERQLSFLSKKVSKAELFQKRGKTRK